MTIHSNYLLSLHTGGTTGAVHFHLQHIYTLVTGNSYFISLSKIHTLVSGAHNEKKIRGEEHDMTTHLIKLHVFTHASCVTKFSASFVLRQRDLTKL